MHIWGVDLLAASGTYFGRAETKEEDAISITSPDFVAHTATTHITRFIDDASYLVPLI